jgi:hypothetical protein
MYNTFARDWQTGHRFGEREEKPLEAIDKQSDHILDIENAAI